MERHRTLDSSMSSLYSGSNISNATNTRQHDMTNNYPTLSSSASPTPSAHHHQQQQQQQRQLSTGDAMQAGAHDVGGASGGMDIGAGNAVASSPSTPTTPNLRAITIGTVVVRCGPIQLVIALLQSPDKIYIKVVELEPKITTLGENLDEALHMQREHDETLRNVQNLPGPMDEFVQKADKLLASKRISSQLVNAMADTLNIIWQDILNLLHDRQHILHLCSQFHDKMTQCQRRMDQLEVACIETMLPIEVNAVQDFLNKFKQLRIDMLTAVMAALKDGNELLAQLQDFEKMETLDTRPEHIKRDAARAVHQVQQWLEALHDRRNALEIAWQTRKTQLEQCLALALLGRELNDLELALQQQRNEVNTLFSLGECEHTANNALHNYRDWKQQALVLRDRALKITRAKEKLQASGTFSGDEACAKAYGVLSECTEHLDLVDQREHWLQQSRDFFGKAEKTLGVLEKLEVELANAKLPAANTAESFAMYAKVARDVRNFTEEPLRLGYSILDDVGRTQPETQGVKRVLDEIENRKTYIEGICSASNEDHVRVQQALNEFLEQYNDLLEWLRMSGQMYLQQNVDMGRNLAESKQFLLQHHELMQDLEIKGELINLLLESIKSHLESLSPQQRFDVDSKAEALHKHWIELKDLVLRRVDCVSVLIEFFEKANELAMQWDNLQRELRDTPDEKKLDFLQSTWSGVRNEFAELKNRGKRFHNLKIVDPYLETKSSADAIDGILNDFSKRQIDVTTSLENWTTHIAEKHEVEVILEKIMSDNEETAAKTTKVDTQLYPVFTTASVDAKYLQTATSEKLQLVLQDIEQAQEEIQQRVHTTLNLQVKDQQSQQKIEQVISNLRTLKSKLDGIKYDYRTLLDSILNFLHNLIELRHEIDDFFGKQQLAQPPAVGNAIERILIEHEKFRDACMEKFRSLITQSELLIDRVRVLEPPGAREIDTDRILKLLENLRVHFEAGLSERMSTLGRLDKLEQFKGELCDINRSLDSVSKQLHEINGQSVDSLAAAKTTSLAFEYFERTIESSMPKFLVPIRHQLRWGFSAGQPLELLEKRIDKFSETTTQQLLVTNPESEAFVRDELRKLNEKWLDFKEQVRNKRTVLNQATEFFEMVEKIDAEYREITYFYNSISNKITYLRDPIEAANLVNDIEKYIGSREGALREKLENATRCSHDMNKVSQLYNDVMTIFQSFVKLKADINIVEERLKNEERQREQREREAREQAEREKAQREAEAREREAAARERAAREEAARLEALREQTARELAAREMALREEEARLQAVREQAAREQAAREQAAREEEARLRSLREEEARLLAQREQAQRDQEARLQAAREQVVREEAERLRALREEDAKLHAQREQATREQEARLRAAREQAAREDEARLRTLREEEARLQTLREQAKREEEARLLALREQTKREEEARLQALREQTQRDTEQRLKVTRDHVDEQRIITENIRKDIQVNQIFTELKYASPYFTRPLADAIAREGDKFTFECVVTGIPEPTVEWFKDGISIQNNPDYKTSYDQGLCRLLIEETFAADSARFCCRASNLVGVTDTCASLSVRENVAEAQMIPPRFVRSLMSGKAREGSSYEFSCVVSGNPLPTVQWFKNDKFIDDSPDYIINFNNGEATLRFEEVFLEDDAIYTCRATNPAGIEHCTATLMVEPLEPTEMPYFKIPLSNAMARVGQKVKIEALIGGIPRPDVFWMHNGKPYHPRESKYEYGRVTLVIPQAYPNDAGIYVLTAKNLAGEAYSSCNVIVKGRLPNETSDSEMASDMEPIKPSVQLPLKDVSIFEGKPVRLDCVIVGQPEPEVIWYHNDRPIKESADLQLLFQGDRCTLIIQEAYQEDAGNYKVVAINSGGEASSECELMVTPLNVAEPATRAQSERQSMPLEMQPKFEKLLTDVLVDEGETVELHVIATGDQPLAAKWYFTNKELLPNERISMLSDAEAGVFKLVIRQVHADDRGVYTVKVANNAGEAKCFSHLITKSVNVPEHQQQQQQQSLSTHDIVERQTCPEFKEVFGDKNAHIDEVVKFECIVKGKPTPKVHWYFKDKPVHGHNFLVSTSGERQVLTIQQACSAAVGKISCVAENEVGKATCVAYLNLIGPGLMQPLPGTSEQQSVTQEHNTESSRVTIKKQTFTTTSTSQVNSYEGNMPAQTEVHHSSAHIDQSLKQLAGAQRPEIMESHHYQELHKSKDMSSPSVQQKSFVFIQSAGQAQPAGVSPLVPGSPTRLRKELAPRFTMPLTGKIVDQGADVSMEAIYDGFPSPEIKVEKNGETLFENAHTKIVNKCNRVTIDLKDVHTTDAGRYAVTATNTMGQSTSTADLVVKKTIFPPVFGRRLQAQVVKKGEKLIMEVEVTGLPEPTVTWMKDEKPLKEANISEHRLLAQGNSYKLIIEKAQVSDTGKYMVKATNAGGEAKSIADCAILEPTPERMQEVVKTIVYETPSEIKTENFNKEPLSFENAETDVATTATNLHGVSESKIITEHRCTTEATMRLEHKSPHIDLAELSPRPRTPTIITTPAPPTTKTQTTTTNDTQDTHMTSTSSSSSSTTTTNAAAVNFVATTLPHMPSITMPSMPHTTITTITTTTTPIIKPITTTTTNTANATPSHITATTVTTSFDTIDLPQATKTVSFSTELASVKKIPPQVPPKPIAHKVPIIESTTTTTTEMPYTTLPDGGGMPFAAPQPPSSLAMPESNDEKQLTSSSFEFFKKMETSIATPQPHETTDTYKRLEDLPRLSIPKPSDDGVSAPPLASELRNLNLEPGTPPEICFVPSHDSQQQTPRRPLINDKIQKIEDFQKLAQNMVASIPPKGGVATLPPAVQPAAGATTYKHETTISKEVKIEYGQPVIRPAANLQTLATPAQAQRSPSPKPSAEGIAMSKLWTPTTHVSGYESCTSDFEHTRTESETEQQLKSQKAEREVKIPKLSTPTHELSAPYLVKQVSKALTIPTTTSATPETTKPLRTIDDIELVPGTPPEICYAPKPEGPKKVVPLSVPTLTPPQLEPMPKKQTTYKPPPPVLPKTKLGRGDTYESDYESDRWKYSGSESDEASFRRPFASPAAASAAATAAAAPMQQNYQPQPAYTPFKTSGYAADTEEMSSYKKMESSMHESREMRESRESRMFYERTHETPKAQPQTWQTVKPQAQAPPQQQQQHQSFPPQMAKPAPAQMYYAATQNGGSGNTMKQESYSSSKEYKHEEKEYKSTMSMSSNMSYNMSATSATPAAPVSVPPPTAAAPKYPATPVKPQAAPSPVPMQRKTPAEFSDYSSEVDERFRSVSRQYESDSEIKGYRVVFPPTPTPRGTSITNGHKSPVVVVTPSPMEFEPTPSPITTFGRPKFEPIKKEITHEIKTESMQQQKQYQHQQPARTMPQPVYKPKPVAAKFLAATQKQQQQQPTLYYNAVAGTPMHMAKMATETKNVMQMKESSETCERIVNMQQTKRVIHFDSQKQEERATNYSSSGPQPAQQSQQHKPLEPFPYRPSPSRQTPVRHAHYPPPATPTKFIPGEMRESDYESEVENAKIRPLWTPRGEQMPLGYRHVEPPQPNRACSVPRTLGSRVLSPMEFDRGPEMPQKIQVDVNSLRRERRSSTSNLPHKTQTLGRHTTLRSTSANAPRPVPQQLPTTNTYYEQQYQRHEQQQQQQQNFARDDMNLKVGSPPKYGYIQAQADAQAKRLGSTFLQKSQQFIDDITTDFQKKSSMTEHKTESSTTTTSSSTRKLYEQNVSANAAPVYGMRPGFKRAPSEGDNRPQAYRDESRISQYGTKCVDPDTGLIYFKYDFGYEFGILFPGEGRKFVGGQWNKSTAASQPSAKLTNGTATTQTDSGRKSPYPLKLPAGSDLVIPVQHERSAGGATATRRNTATGSTMPSYTNGYHSDVEMRRSRSPAPPTFRNHSNALRKRFSLPNTQNIDINIDGLHANDTLLSNLPYMRSVPDLPSDVPVNAHLNRDELAKKSPMFITPLKEIAVAAGGTARFECIVQAHPQPNITWTKNENELQNNQKFLIEYRNGVCRLTIPKAYPDDAGVYACNAVNALGAATTSGQLQVSCNSRGFNY